MQQTPKNYSSLTPQEALDLQIRLQRKIKLKSKYSSLSQIKIVAGTDVHFSLREDCATGSIAIFSFPDLKLIEKKSFTQKRAHFFPYIPGLLSFRELPLLLGAWEKVKTFPQIIICDGQGIAHPRRLGLATHLGILLNLPTIGCAKSSLYGTYEEPPKIKGAYTYIKDEKGKIIGAVLRTKPKVKPLFISPGYKIDVELATDIIFATASRYRIPEPLRYAHQLAKKRL